MPSLFCLKFHYFSQCQVTNTTKPLRPFPDTFDSIIHCFFFSSPHYRSYFLIHLFFRGGGGVLVGGRRLQLWITKIQMPSLKPAESQKPKSKKGVLSPPPPLPRPFSPEARKTVCLPVCVCVFAHVRVDKYMQEPGSSKRPTPPPPPPALHVSGAWQVSGSSSKGCPHSACLEALL